MKTVFGWLASVPRISAGTWVRPSHVPAQLLELWSFEASPFCRLVREALCEFEIPYILHNVAAQSANRSEFLALSGKMQVPFLRDPNTDRMLFESADIVDYLVETYGDPA